MKNETFKEAFSCVTASDDMVSKAMQIPEEAEVRPSFSGLRVARRVAAAAVSVAVLIGAMVLPGPPVTVTDPTGGTQVVHMPLFSVQVYANNEYVDLSSDSNETIYAGDENTNTNSEFGRLENKDPMIFNTTTGEWEKWDIYEKEKLPMFEVVIWYHKLPNKADVLLEIYQDGERVNPGKENRNFKTTIVFAMDDMEGFGIWCCVEEQSTLEFVVKNNAGDILLRHKVLVTPAIYETQMDSNGNDVPNGEPWVSKNEGYMLEVLESYQIELN